MWCRAYKCKRAVKHETDTAFKGSLILTTATLFLRPGVCGKLLIGFGVRWQASEVFDRRFRSNSTLGLRIKN